MSALSPEEEAVLRELELELEKPADPLPNDVRLDRFIAEPVGMDDGGELFPVPEPERVPGL